MADRWIVTIDAWPFHGVDQDFAGNRTQNYLVDVSSFKEAVDAADLLQRGILSNPAVWQAPIKSVRQCAHDEYQPREEKPSPVIYVSNSKISPHDGGK